MSFWKILAVLAIACVLQCEAQGSDPPMTRPQVEQLINDMWDEKAPTIIDDVIADIDFGKEFKEITGITIGALIAIIIVVIIVPNILILCLIFLCCFICKCGAFRRVEDHYYDKNATTVPSPMTSAYGQQASSKPIPPPRPTHSQPTSPTQQEGSGLWPWGNNKQDDYQLSSGSGVQNSAYRSNW